LERQVKWTQINLDEELCHFLKEESRGTGKTVSEIIRSRLWSSLGENRFKVEQLLKAVERASGAWEESIEPESFVREMRRGKRIDSFGYRCGRLTQKIV